MRVQFPALFESLYTVLGEIKSSVPLGFAVYCEDFVWPVRRLWCAGGWVQFASCCPVANVFACEADLRVLAEPGHELPGWHWWGLPFDAFTDLLVVYPFGFGPADQLVGFLHPVHDEPCDAGGVLVAGVGIRVRVHRFKVGLELQCVKVDGRQVGGSPVASLCADGFRLRGPVDHSWEFGEHEWDLVDPCLEVLDALVAEVLLGWLVARFGGAFGHG